MGQEMSSLQRPSSNKIIISLLKYIFYINNPHPLLNQLYKQFFENPINNDDYVSFTKYKNVLKKIRELKKKFDSQKYDIFMLRDLISKISNM
jgi:hypothetical protein